MTDYSKLEVAGIEYAVRRDVDGGWFSYDGGDDTAWEGDPDNATWYEEPSDIAVLVASNRLDLNDGYSVWERPYHWDEDIDEDYETPKPTRVDDPSPFMFGDDDEYES